MWMVFFTYDGGKDSMSTEAPDSATARALVEMTLNGFGLTNVRITKVVRVNGG